MNGEEILQLAYPGRGVIVGFDDESAYSVYFVMGRSPSSQARILEKNGNIIRTKPTDLDVLKNGNPELLLYNGIAFLDNFIAVSNGRQTDTIFTEQLSLKGGVEDKFINSLDQWNSEPDAPNYTPRIAGVAGLEEAYLGIVKQIDGETDRESFKVKPNTLAGITTYTGINENPLPSYMGEPFTLELHENIVAAELAEIIWDLLNPDFRVSLAAVIINPLDYPDSHVINRFKQK